MSMHVMILADDVNNNKKHRMITVSDFNNKNFEQSDTISLHHKKTHMSYMTGKITKLKRKSTSKLTIYFEVLSNGPWYLPPFEWNAPYDSEKERDYYFISLD